MINVQRIFTASNNKEKISTMNTYLVIFNLEGKKQKVYVSAGTEQQAQRIFERDYMFDEIIEIIEQ